VDKYTRKDLKTDKFAAEVRHSVEYVSSHRQQAIRYGGAALALIAVVAVIYAVRQSGQSGRQEDLARALNLRDATIGSPQPGDPRPAFPSQADKDTAILKAFQDLAAKHGGSNEAAVAHVQLGSIAADKGKLDDAVKHFQAAIDAGNDETASVAKWSLAQACQAQGKTAEAEKLLREIIADPTLLVSKEQATFSLIRVLASTKPNEAHKLLEPLQKAESPVVARNAGQIVTELPAKK
jgi:predicted negative regulator of RcsB-dependent stress response